MKEFSRRKKVLTTPMESAYCLLMENALEIYLLAETDMILQVGLLIFIAQWKENVKFYLLTFLQISADFTGKFQELSSNLVLYSRGNTFGAGAEII